MYFTRRYKLVSKFKTSTKHLACKIWGLRVSAWQHHKEEKIRVDNKKIGQNLVLSVSTVAQKTCTDWRSSGLRSWWEIPGPTSHKTAGMCENSSSGQFIPTIPWILTWFPRISVAWRSLSRAFFMLWCSRHRKADREGTLHSFAVAPRCCGRTGRDRTGRERDRGSFSTAESGPASSPGSRARRIPRGKGPGSSSGAPPSQTVSQVYSGLLRVAKIGSKETPKSEQ